MQRIVLLLFITLSPLYIFSQSENPEPCGTVELGAERQAFLDGFYDHKHEYEQSRSTAPLWYIPVTIHLVGTDQGVGYMKTVDVWKMLCNLNEQFEPSDLFFYLQGDINFIANSDYYQHNFQVGYQMMNNNNRPNTINIYIVDDPAGNCGYFSGFGDAVAIKKSCAGNNNTTVAHEIGHYLSLPHTFSGWEGGNTPPSFDQEKVNGTNCQVAGDQFCDTPPDYVYYRWSCPYSGPQLTDPDGVNFIPDPTYYMSYSSDQCQDKFSNDQITAMRGFIQFNRTSLLLQPDPPPYTPLDVVELSEPADSATNINPGWAIFSWDPVPGATKYHIQVSRYATFAFINFEAVVEGTSATAHNLDPNVNYRWNVLPLSETNTCEDYSSIRTFKTGEPSGIELSSGYAEASLFPNPASGNEFVTLIMGADKPDNVDLSIYSVTGQIMYGFRVDLVTGENAIEIPTENLMPGLYLVHLAGREESISLRMVIIE